MAGTFIYVQVNRIVKETGDVNTLRHILNTNKTGPDFLRNCETRKIKNNTKIIVTS